MAATTRQMTVQRLEAERRERLREGFRRRIEQLPRRARFPSLREQLLSLAQREETVKLFEHLYEQGKDALLEPTMRKWRQNIQDIVKPTPQMRIPDFIEDRQIGRKLPPENGLTPGPVKISKQEIARSILLAVHEPGVRTISVCMSPQMCKTFIIECIYAYFAVIDPTTVMIVMPDDQSLKEFVYGKLDKMIENMPSLKGRLTKNDLGIKMGPGFLGIQTIAGSDRRLAGKTIRIVLLDEIDKPLPGKGGDFVDLADKRAVTFKDLGLSYRSCTPTTEKGRIWGFLMNSDIRRYFVECPHCGVEQAFRWSDDPRPEEEMEDRYVRWKEDATGKAIPGTLRMHCQGCDEPFSDPQRKRALRAGVMRQTKPFTCCGEEQDPLQLLKEMHPKDLWNHDHYDGVGYVMCRHHRNEDGSLNHECKSVREPAIEDLPGSAVTNRDIGYHGWHAQSQLIEVDDMASDFVNGKAGPKAWQSFMNNTLALPYSGSRVVDIDFTQLLGRREAYTSHQLNDRAVFLTCGVDRQKNYLSYQVVAWGRGRESWLVTEGEFNGSTLMDAPWVQLDNFLAKSVWYTKSGRPMKIEVTCVDTGGGFGVEDDGFAGTERAKRFCLERMHRNILPIAGARNDGRVDDLKDIFDPRGAFGKSVYYVGTVQAKMQVMDWLVVGPDPQPGYCHFPADVRLEFLKSLTSEQKVIDPESGKIGWEKKKGHRRNEALDTRVYALAASYAFEYIHGTTIDREADMKRIPYLPSEEEIVATRTSMESLKAMRKAVSGDNSSSNVDGAPRPVVNLPQRRAYPVVPRNNRAPVRPRRPVPRF